MRYLHGLAAGSLLFSACAAHAAGIDKGPYLMSPTQTGITVCWVSDSPTTGTVKVADSGETAGDTTPTRYHRVKLTGLKPYTHYSYSVTCAGETKSGGFTTAAP